MLGDAIHAPFDAAAWMPTIGERERERLALPQLRYVMMLATRPEDIASGKAAPRAPASGIARSKRAGLATAPIPPSPS